MLLLDKSTREIEQACAAALFQPVKWIELTNGLPEPGEHVMVKMEDGLVEIHSWDSARVRWTQNPFESSGQPVAWASLPPFNSNFGLAC